MARKRFTRFITILIAVTFCSLPAAAQISPSLFPLISIHPRNASAQAEPQKDKPRPFAEPDAEEAVKLEKFLTDWQRNGAAIKTFQMEVNLWTYEPNFLIVLEPKTGELVARRILAGNLKLDTEKRNFDFTIDHLWRFRGIDQETDEPKYSQDNWQSRLVRFGKSIYEYDFSQRTISDLRPLFDLPKGRWFSFDYESTFPWVPFVFRSVDQLQETYGIRIAMAEPSNEQYTVIELFPNKQESTLQKLTAWIDNKTWQLTSLETVARTGNRTMYKFTDFKINMDADVEITDPTQDIPRGWQLRIPVKQ